MFAVLKLKDRTGYFTDFNLLKDYARTCELCDFEIESLAADDIWFHYPPEVWFLQGIDSANELRVNRMILFCEDALRFINLQDQSRASQK